MLDKIAQLPDVTSDHVASNPLPLQWVGMDAIAVPVRLRSEEGVVSIHNAKANLYVSLDQQDAKGIHMSRLHLLLNQLADAELNISSIDQLLDNMVRSQADIANNAKVELEFDVLLKKPSLSGTEFGYQTYPVKVSAERVNQLNTYQIELTVPYSSTCPCSASLSRQLYAQAINDAFQSESIDKNELLGWVESSAGSVATPHSQRSYAYLSMKIDKHWPDFEQLIQQLETVIGTPVQTAVKRQDEQEFARLNAQNLMFCEDAARKIKSHLEQQDFVTDYWFKVEHQESLHAHNAVVVDQKFPNR